MLAGFRGVTAMTTQDTQDTTSKASTAAEVERRLLAGESPQSIAEALGLETTDDERSDEYWEGLGVVLPGWLADDGNAEVFVPTADSGSEAAQEYVDGGDWGEIESTTWIKVAAWRIALVLDTDGPAPCVTPVEIDRDTHTVEIEPDEPDCSAEEHDWRSPHSVVGGLKENPGVVGHGGGVIMTEVCRHCGHYREVDTWAQNPDTGEQGLESVSYREPDEQSLEWTARKDAESLVEALAQWGEPTVDGTRITMLVSTSAADSEYERREEDSETMDAIRAALPSGWTADWVRCSNGDNVWIERE